MTKISIHSLQIATTIGQYAFERTAPQCITVDLDYWTDTEIAETTDQIGGTVDYAAVALAIAPLRAPTPMWRKLAPRVP